MDYFKIKIGEGSTFFDIAVEGLKQFKVNWNIILLFSIRSKLNY
jgi:hypothetical protein